MKNPRIEFVLVPAGEFIMKSFPAGGKDPFKTRWVKGKLEPCLAAPVEFFAEYNLYSSTDLEWAPKYIRENPERFPFYK